MHTSRRHRSRVSLGILIPAILAAVLLGVSLFILVFAPGLMVEPNARCPYCTHEWHIHGNYEGQAGMVDIRCPRCRKICTAIVFLRVHENYHSGE